MDIAKLIKQKMIEQGRDDFVTYLAEILGISKQWASAKLNGKATFTSKELALLDKELDFDPIQFKNALGS